MNTITHHIGADIFYDSRHRVIKTKLEGGAIGELVQELRDGKYTYQLINIINNGQSSIIEE